ncbi:MAG: hypothetical protein Q8P68_01565, partial [Candidatus Peregrinibacteria bacterium]|nr:hypothetical protein [Candidatus Peregrinibacteria bacterium]MDZ4244669.1 hypothetical protein [Candidatus Gracilibacteria bacterium]
MYDKKSNGLVGKNTLQKSAGLVENTLQKSAGVKAKNDLLAAKNLHKKFISLGNQRNKITHELILLIPEIYKK